MSLRRICLAALGSAVLAILFILFSNPVPNSGEPVIASDLSEAELVERGQYLVAAANCGSCHTAVGSEFMAGGVAFETDFGTLYSTNITPDPGTGIGLWSERDFLNSMRYGVRPSGEHLYPAFPYTSFTKVPDQDIAAIYAYLQKVPAVNQGTPENALSFPFGFRPLMAFWKILFFDAGVFEPVEQRSDEWNRGAYLVEALAHCSACHTPRNILGAQQTAKHMSGGEYLDRIPGGEHRYWSAPNLSSTDRGLALWSLSDLEAYLKTAENSFIESFGPMNDVTINSTRYLEEADIGAMALYLKSLPAIDEGAAKAPDAELLGRGRTIYNLHCGTCHLPTGEGDPQMGPTLNAASLVVQSDNPASMINAILYGPELAGESLPPKWREPMEAYQYILNDDELAAVASFIRSSWNNNAGVVSAEQVARQR